MINFPKSLYSMCLLQLLAVALTIIGWLTRTWTQKWFNQMSLRCLNFLIQRQNPKAKGHMNIGVHNCIMCNPPTTPPPITLKFAKCTNGGRFPTFLEISMVVLCRSETKVGAVTTEMWISGLVESTWQHLTPEEGSHSYYKSSENVLTRRHP